MNMNCGTLMYCVLFHLEFIVWDSSKEGGVLAAVTQTGAQRVVTHLGTQGNSHYCDHRSQVSTVCIWLEF